MRILVDTNVILDVLLNRKDFIAASQGALEKAIQKGDRLYFSSASATDVYYLIRKQTGCKETALNGIKKMAEFLTFAEVNENCVLAATLSRINDYEDAVVDAVGANLKADFILTRNAADFKNAHCKAITPSDYVCA